MMDMSEGSESGLPWLDQPVFLHSSRADSCTLTPEQCAYRRGHWRYWYLIAFFPTWNIMLLIASSLQVPSRSCLRLEYHLFHVCNYRDFRHSTLPFSVCSDPDETECRMAEDNGRHAISHLQRLPVTFLAVLVSFPRSDSPGACRDSLFLWLVCIAFPSLENREDWHRSSTRRSHDPWS